MAAAAVFTLGLCSAAFAFEREKIVARAESAGFRREDVPAGRFTLASWSRLGAPGEPLTVYIEGDGFAWRSRRRLSTDPTPHHPVALDLASRDPSPNVVYLARPCQYVRDSACSSEYWSDRRFSEEVVESASAAIDRFKKTSGAKEVRLVGFSGGAAVAVLAAAGRGDVVSLRTVAGNLDPDAVNASHAIGPLEGSLNPADRAASLTCVPQKHFIGTKDRVIPGSVARAFAAKTGACASVVAVEGAEHVKGWGERWEALLRQDISCAEAGGG